MILRNKDREISPDFCFILKKRNFVGVSCEKRRKIKKYFKNKKYFGENLRIFILLNNF